MGDVYERWNSTPDDELTLSIVEECLNQIYDNVYVATAVVDRVIDDEQIQRALLAKGLESTIGAVDQAKDALLTGTDGDDEARGDDNRDDDDDTTHVASTSAAAGDERNVRLLCLRAILLRRLDLVNTYVAMKADLSWNASPSAVHPTEDEEEDPWADEMEEELVTTEEPILPPFSLSQFLHTDILYSAMTLASTLRFGALKILQDRHYAALFPYRFTILESIPEYVHPFEYAAILPALDFSNDLEQPPASDFLPRGLDWVETDEGKRLIQGSVPADLLELVEETPDEQFQSAPTLLSGASLSVWYRSRIGQIDAEAGLTDIALELVQYGASQGIPNLDELGEELSLLARLVYDAPQDPEHNDNGDWTLERWRSMDESSIVRGYLAHSTPETIASDILRLVMPYLFVLEARHERIGTPDPTILTRHLYSYILNDASLSLSLAIFSASKPTEANASRRIVRKDEDLARLALAKLYGSSVLDDWATMSEIFECLPEWSGTSPTAQEDGDEEADTTISSLAHFVEPSATRGHATPADLFVFFSPLPAPALSRALDILDVHLECGEILARWNVPAPLRWFLQSAQDQGQQRAWATRLARRATNGDYGLWGEDEVEMDSEAQYVALLEDMLKLVGSSSEEGGRTEALRGAFRLLSKKEVTKIFFSGLLSAGKFGLAQSLLRKPILKVLTPPDVEDLSLTASREFYDNSSSGNFHHGDMKLAYDCLAVPPSTPQIQKERLFIEATSRICSFHIVSRPGIPITPLEIRLTKDRLTLISRVLSENEDTYKHPEVILDLVHKLGFEQGDVVAESKTLAMLADSAMQAEDFVTAAEMGDRMVRSVRGLTYGQSQHAHAGNISAEMKEAQDVCWRTCFQLGRQSEFKDVKRKLVLLGHALELCPADVTLDVLAIWRKVEGEDVAVRKLARVEGRTRRQQSNKPSQQGGGLGLNSASASRFAAALSETRAHLSDYAPTSPQIQKLLSPDAAAIASKTFSRVAANFPFSVRGRFASQSQGEGDVVGSTGGGQSVAATSGLGSVVESLSGRSVRSGRSESVGTGTPDVGAHARQALARGMGWLIGADEEAG